ncbi:hypothetical protein JT358_10215 [Micrococcales bacterium 31B]|nr:hypothetical protein [Micrococcales bacterium 31B]
MIPTLTYAFMAVAGLYSLYSIVEFARNKLMGRVLFFGAFGLVGLTVVAIIVSIVEMVLGHEPGDMVIFIGYALTALIMMPAAFMWALLNRNRYGTLTLGIGALVLLVLFARMLQVWNGAQI